MERLILARHGHARSNVRDVVSSTPPGEGLSTRGVEEAVALGEALEAERVDLAVASELVRTQETVAVALEGRDVPLVVLPSWNEIGFGSFEDGPLAAYREWAWTRPADEVAPGEGESRGAVALRVAVTLENLLARPDATMLVVGHALPVRYVLDGVAAAVPQPRITPVQHAVPHHLTRREISGAARLLRAWGAAPAFAVASQA